MNLLQINKKYFWVRLAALAGMTASAYVSACIYIWQNRTRFIFMPQREFIKLLKGKFDLYGR